MSQEINLRKIYLDILVKKIDPAELERLMFNLLERTDLALLQRQTTHTERAIWFLQRLEQREKLSMLAPAIEEIGRSDIDLAELTEPPAQQPEKETSSLARELALLRKELEDIREKDAQSQSNMDIDAVAAAEDEAKQGNQAEALEHLSKVGRWVLDVATKIGVSVATAAIKESLGT